jgi:hypothetical protein
MPEDRAAIGIGGFTIDVMPASVSAASRKHVGINGGIALQQLHEELAHPRAVLLREPSYRGVKLGYASVVVPTRCNPLGTATMRNPTS